MTTIIAGRFTQQDHAETTFEELLRSGFARQEMSLFYVNPQGQHGMFPIGGDEDESEGTHEASSGAMRGAAGGVGVGTLVGAATLPVFGPVAPLLGAAVGAYTGSLVGALNHMKESEECIEEKKDAPLDADPDEIHERKAGLLLAVAVHTPKERASAIQILSARAVEMEEAEGVIENGQWIDFNPLKPIKTIDELRSTASGQ